MLCLAADLGSHRARDGAQFFYAVAIWQGGERRERMSVKHEMANVSGINGAQEIQ